MTHVRIPEQLARQAQIMVDQGWASSVDAVVVEALRRFLESHQERLTEGFLRVDMDWALAGSD